LARVCGRCSFLFPRRLDVCADAWEADAWRGTRPGKANACRHVRLRIARKTTCRLVGSIPPRLDPLPREDRATMLRSFLPVGRGTDPYIVSLTEDGNQRSPAATLGASLVPAADGRGGPREALPAGPGDDPEGAFERWPVRHDDLLAAGSCDPPARSVGGNRGISRRGSIRAEMRSTCGQCGKGMLRRGYQR